MGMKRSLLGLCATLVCSLGASVAQPTVTNWADTYGKSTTEFTDDDWRAVVDGAWGFTGLSTAQQLEHFDRWYTNIDRLYGAFQDLDFDIENFRDTYRPEIEQGVSRGRFSAIMNHFAYRLQDLHTYVWDNGVRGTTRQKGVPLLVVGQFGNNNGFGAVITPLADSTLVVYRTFNSHPLDLEAGDVILGYDGVLWKDIYPKLIEAELPLFVNPVNASTDEGNQHYLLEAAGLNWHLFDTLDVVKYSTGDTLHFNTNLLANERRTIWGSEHIDVPGVTWPDRSTNDRVGWGVVEGTEVGYVYVTSWGFQPEFDIRNKFRQAVVDLWFTQRVKGIIFDFRYNTGGGALATDAWNLMYNEVTPTVGFDERADPNDHFLMREDPLRRATNLTIRPDATTFWDRPIAVLIGPGAISAGELEARRISFHPNTRTFGLPAGGGNTGSIFPTWPVGSPFFGSFATSGQFLTETHEYITRSALQPDERVWHNREAVANGVDAVVEAALSWINDEVVTSTEEVVLEVPGASIAVSAYPNPFSSSTTLELVMDGADPILVEIFDVLGRRVARPLDEIRASGTHTVRWDGRADEGNRLPNGTYYARFTVGGFATTLPLTLIW